MQDLSSIQKPHHTQQSSQPSKGGAYIRAARRLGWVANVESSPWRVDIGRCWPDVPTEHAILDTYGRTPLGRSLCAPLGQALSSTVEHVEMTLDVKPRGVPCKERPSQRDRIKVT